MQMYLLHHKIQKVLEVQDNHEGIDYYPPYHVWPSSTTALLDKPLKDSSLGHVFAHKRFDLEI